MSDVFCSHQINFEKSEVVLNALTKKVLPESLAMEFLETEREGVNCMKNLLKNE